MKLSLFYVPWAEFRLHVPIRSEDGQEEFFNYTRSYYVFAINIDDAHLVLQEEALRDGATLQAKDTITLAPSSAIAALKIDSPSVRGVVWKSGRSFFPVE